MSGQPIRMMIVGIPNVGKSSLINRLAGAKRAKVEDRPGVTRGRQWVSLAGGIDLLDMPGVLWPKFEDPAVGERLAFTGAVKDDVLDAELLAMRLLWLLNAEYPAQLAARYHLKEGETDGLDAYGLLCLVGKKRGDAPPGRRGQHRAGGDHRARRIPQRKARQADAGTAAGGLTWTCTSMS